jgi:hypothetical protein
MSVGRRRREAPRCRRLLIALLASAASFAIRDAPAAEDPCAVKLFRWQEDCRNLFDRQASLGPLERLRYLPLNMSKTVWLTLGAGPSYVTALSHLRADWTPRPGAIATLSYVHGDAGSLIRSAGGHPCNYLAFWLDLHR